MKEWLFWADEVEISLKEGKRHRAAVRNVSISMGKEENIGIIGESGCGKSLFCKSVLGILDREKWETKGRYYFQGKKLPVADGYGRRGFNGIQAGYICQDPQQAFDPRMRIGKHFREMAQALGMDGREALEEAVRLMGRMGLVDADKVLESYSFELSGGQLQRVMIALALTPHPGLLVADEPTTALDVAVQQEILFLLKGLCAQEGMGILIVSHDLRVIEQMADFIYVMYAGMIVEEGEREQVLGDPLHPYTKGLLASRPSFSKKRISVMEGYPPGIGESFAGCPFAERCQLSKKDLRCTETLPELLHDHGAKDEPAQRPNHRCRCWKCR